MRILLDECVDQKMRLLFPEHECQTAAYARLAGLKNGVLLAAAEAAALSSDEAEPTQPLVSEADGMGARFARYANPG